MAGTPSKPHSAEYKRKRQQAMADRQTINHFLERAAKDLERLRSEAVRIGGDDLEMFAYLIDRALAEARSQTRKDE